MPARALSDSHRPDDGGQGHGREDEGEVTVDEVEHSASLPTQYTTACGVYTGFNDEPSPCQAGDGGPKRRSG
jgi:hypothetical protein